ncbi:hypothetical protein RUM43_014976 [Polyplax serrata]|uniref:Copper homeostasis protein cutC homolog n=1 Tax=Polyplax serrata TaxID=468196 RepID=A0AAN8NP63_POLSC
MVSTIIINLSNHTILEVCVDSIESALSAAKGGATRIELCSALQLGGLTPSVGLLKAVKNLLPPHCIVFVMIRPKSGYDFHYNSNELNIMMDDIKILAKHGADGFVFGCLTKNKEVDIYACKKLLDTAKEYPCTFHRAFDVVCNPEHALLSLIDLGFSRILTSGQAETAHLGKNVIKELVCNVKELNSDLIIVAGGGIDLNNLGDILETTQVKEFHGSARLNLKKEDTIWLTDESVVREMIKIANSLKMKKL